MSRPTPAPPVRFARTVDGGQIAYCSLGRGPALIEVPHVQMSHLRAQWSIDAVRRWCTRMSRTHRLIRFDNRGGGLSRGPSSFALDALAADIESLADTLRIERFALVGLIAGSLPAIRFAARHPERVTALVLWNGFVRNVDHGQHARLRSLFDMAASDWELFTESISQAALGWQDAQAARQWALVLREATDPDAFGAYLAARREWDVTDVLRTIRAPTLVLHDERNRLASEERCRELAAGIPDAHFVAADSVAGMPGPGAMDTIERFLDPSAAAPRGGPEGLTPREREVLALLASGASNTMIAERLCISVNTVTRHLTHIYAKTGVSNRVAAARYAVDRDLVGRAGDEPHASR
jgi:DNA-binding NarL/FixJ family response regulator